MSIEIIDEPGPPIRLTKSRYDQLHAEYRQAFSFYAGQPPSFEAWLRSRGKTFATTDPRLPVTKGGES